jgi:hypothetical protein
MVQSGALTTVEKAPMATAYQPTILDVMSTFFNACGVDVNSPFTAKLPPLPPQSFTSSRSIPTISS